jgi:hypothetical protein
VFATASGSNGIYSLKEFEVYGSVINGCNTPTGLTVNDIDSASAVIRWNPTSTATGYKVRFKPKSSSVWQTFNTTEDTLLVDGLSCNTYYQYSVQSKCDADTSTSTNVGEFNTLGCNNCILPTRVNQTDVGNVGEAGLGCYVKPDNYSVNASGADIGGTADAFHFVYYDFTGDADCSTKVASIDNVNPSNKAGIMIREGVDADSRSVFLGLTSSNKLVFLNRQNTGGSTITVVNQSGFSPPYFLKIVKIGSEFSGYISPNNTNWTLIGTTINQMTTNGAHAGLAVTSHDNTQLSNAKFNGLTVNAFECGPLPKKTFSSNIGNGNINGNACYYAYNRYVVNGSGDIANKTDAFFYVYQTFTGDKTITVKVTDQDQSNPFNKAGIMIRWALAASQTNIFVGLTSGNGAVFQYRNGSNKATQTTFTGNFKAPYFIRLVKSQGSTYLGYISPDGITWQQIGQVVIPPGTKTNFKVGMAVSSGDASQLSNAIFDGWKTEDTSPLQMNLNASSSNSAKNSSLLLTGAEGSLKVYPNPAKKNFTIDCNIPKKQDIFVSIIGAGDGRIYFTQSVTNFSGNYRKEFNESLIPKGSYIISLKTRSGTKTKLLIKE